LDFLIQYLKKLLKAEKKDYSVIKSENNDYIEKNHKIREFEIVNSTPVEAFNFLAEIQKQILEF